MKILFDCTPLSYYNDKSGHRAGIFYVALNLLKEFQKLGIDITFYCNFTRYYYMKNIKEFTDILLLSDFSLINKIIALLLYKTRNINHYIHYLMIVISRIYEKRFFIKNKKNINQINNFDIWFSPFTPPSKDIEASNLYKFRIIHDVIPIMENGLTKASKDWYCWFNRVYNTINSKDYYFTNSNYTRNDVLKYFPFIKSENIKTTLLAANENFYATKEKSPIDGKYIFSLCTLGKRKNLEFGIRNFFSFIHKHNIEDLKLVLGGSIWKKYKKDLNSIIYKYDNSKIILTGYIDEQELAKYYANALCFIYPSLYEGFGLPVLEAMQCGCPVITSNVSSLPEVIGDAGIQINPKSDEEMIFAYEKMYFNRNFREECRQKGIERSKLFSWEKCAREILEFIESKTSS